MIKELLSQHDCAKCRGCCMFDKQDMWELPEKIQTIPSDNVFLCANLTENGCKLGDSKPLECALYPFRIMRLGDYLVVALARYCKVITKLSLFRLVQFVHKKSDEFHKIALDNPQIVKQYNDEYTILKVIYE